MADTKISGLPASTTPLAGTEVLPIVQSGSTVKVAVSDLTAGRAVSALSLTSTNGATIQGLTVGLGAGAVASNTAVGFEAGAGVSTSADNTFIGYQAGKAASTGTGRSVAVGRGALATATTAIDNTVVGYFAGNKITFGNSNAFFGGGVFGTLLSAGNNTTTGSNNTAIGTGALGTNSISGNSTAVGYSAGYVATGIGNQFFGYNSGVAVTTGAKNVILGSYTGSAAPISATGSNNIVLSDGDGNVRQTIDSSGNVLMGATSTAGDANSTKQIVGGTFSTVSGSVSAANATATTTFTAPSTVAAWLVTVNISAAAASLYAATYLVNTQGGSSTVATLIFKGANILITMSGYAVQVTQTSGVTQTVTYSAIRIA